MRLILRYGHRTLAGLYLLVLAGLFVFTASDGTTWVQAWGVVAVAVWLGWQAGREANDDQAAEGGG